MSAFVRPKKCLYEPGRYDLITPHSVQMSNILEPTVRRPGYVAAGARQSPEQDGLAGQSIIRILFCVDHLARVGAESVSTMRRRLTFWSSGSDNSVLVAWRSLHR